jgi:steroid delta-isomerase-like uncharacterized protein
VPENCSGNAAFLVLGRIRMRQAEVDGTILVLGGTIRRKSGSGRSTDVSTEENKRISWRLQEEVFGQGNLKSVDELLAPDYLSHAPGDPELSRGPEDIKQIVRAYHSAFPDINFTVEKQVAEGDMVVTRWIARGTHRGEFMGIPPSGRRIEVSGMSMDRISRGRIVENWNNWEALEMMRQIGAIPDAEHTQGA